MIVDVNAADTHLFESAFRGQSTPDLRDRAGQRRLVQLSPDGQPLAMLTLWTAAPDWRAALTVASAPDRPYRPPLFAALLCAALDLGHTAQVRRLDLRLRPGQHLLAHQTLAAHPAAQRPPPAGTPPPGLACTKDQITALRTRWGLPAPDIHPVSTLRPLNAPPAPARFDAASALRDWCDDQIASARTPQDHAAAVALRRLLSPMISGASAGH